MKKATPERYVQEAIVGYLRRFLPRSWHVVGVSNNPRSKITGAMEKAMGLVAGYPDLTILGELNDRPFTGFIECKSAYGRLTPAQVAMHDSLIDNGFPVAVCRSIDDARDACLRWGLPIREVRFAPTLVKTEGEP